MKKETSAGIIIVFNNKYLLLNYPVSFRAPKEYWGLVKGHIENEESLEETAIREAKEETGIDVEIIQGFKEKILYHFKIDGKLIEKTVYFFVARSNVDRVIISKEHKGFQWLEFDESMKKLNYENDKAVLRKADEFLNKK